MEIEAARSTTPRLAGCIHAPANRHGTPTFGTLDLEELATRNEADSGLARRTDSATIAVYTTMGCGF
jgi:hypothetical protein